MTASDLVERVAPGRAVSRGRRAARGLSLRSSGTGRFDLIRNALLSAFLWAGIPAITAAIYLYAVAADIFQSEAQFVVRGETFPVGAEGGGTLAEIVEINTSQDTRIAADYIASGAVLHDLEGAVDLLQMFRAPGIDPFSGLSGGATHEQRSDYWRGMASAEVEALSGIVTVRTRAFNPQDAQELASSTIAAAEAKLNALHRHSMEGALRVSEERATAAATRLKDARTEIRVFRERYRAIDLNSGASSTFELLSALRRQRIEDRAELAVTRAQGAGSSPIIKALQARIAAADQQIVKLEKDLTSAMGGDRGAASAAIEFYDRLVLRQDMAAQYVARTQAALARASQRLDKRQIYLEVFVPPALPTEAEYPQRTRILLIILAVVLAAWSFVRLVWAGIRSHEV